MAKKYFLYVAIGLVAFLWMMTPAFAQSTTQQMQKKIDDLEKQVNELKLILQEQQKARAEEKARVDKVEQKVDQSEKAKTKTASSGGVVSTASAVISDFKFKPYGYIKLDAAHDDNRASAGNYVLYVPSGDSSHAKHESFSMTARETRLGLDLLAPEKYSWLAKGKVEFDFFGDGTSHENKANVLLRHAYVQLTRGNYDIIAGQTWDVIAPLNPSNLNYSVGWGLGNTGYRRPQIRFTYTQPINDRNKLIAAVAASRTEGLTNEDLDKDLKNDGEDAGYPTVQGRVAWSTKLLVPEKFTTFGFSGHFGGEKIDWSLINTVRHQRTVKSWSINADYDVPLTKCLSLKGEWFLGSNIDDYFGGALQGINNATLNNDGKTPMDRFGEVIRSTGGWTQLTYQINKWKYNLGGGIDDPKNADLTKTTNAKDAMRSRNAYYFANFYYNLIPPVNLCLEYSHFETKYKGWEKGKDNRFQTAVIYNW